MVVQERYDDLYCVSGVASLQQQRRSDSSNNSTNSKANILIDHLRQATSDWRVRKEVYCNSRRRSAPSRLHYRTYALKRIMEQASNMNTELRPDSV